MTTADIIWEYRQIVAWDYEQKHGKPLEEDVVYDDAFEEELAEYGITADDLKQLKGAK